MQKLVLKNIESYTFIFNISDCSSMYPQPPCWGVGGTCWKCLHLPPNPPPELKNVSKIFYTKYFFTQLNTGNVYLIQ